MPLSPEELRELIKAGLSPQEIQLRMGKAQPIFPGQKSLTQPFQGVQAFPGFTDPTLSLEPGFQQTIKEFTKMPGELQVGLQPSAVTPGKAFGPSGAGKGAGGITPLATEVPLDAGKGAPAPAPGADALAGKAPSEFQKSIGLGVLGLGMQQASKGAQSPSIQEFIGGIGTMISGGAMLAGKGGAWAIPVAIFSTLLNMFGQAQAGEVYRKRYANLNQAITRGLVGMKAIHNA